jgi:hypothetical protein
MMRAVELKIVFVQYSPNRKHMERDVVYVSKEFWCAMHLCPCDCGNVCVTPLVFERKTYDANEKARKPQGWFFEELPDGCTWYPSIKNQGCRAHYNIEKSRVIWHSDSGK